MVRQIHTESGLLALFLAPSLCALTMCEISSRKNTKHSEYGWGCIYELVYCKALLLFDK